MTAPPGGSRSIAEEHRLATQAVLEVIIELHPDHLTAAELVWKVAVDPENHHERETVKLAVRDLQGSGLIRSVGDTLAPTHAALRAAEIFGQR
jgi:hypothetical protein